MYEAIAIRAKCLFLHSKYLDSSLLVFSLWLMLIEIRIALLLYICFIKFVKLRFYLQISVLVTMKFFCPYIFLYFDEIKVIGLLKYRVLFNMWKLFVHFFIISEFLLKELYNQKYFKLYNNKWIKNLFFREF